MIKYRVQTKGFISWCNRVQANVREMMPYTLKQAGQFIQKRTEPFVPIDTGILISSFSSANVSTGNFIELEMIYTGRNNPRSKGYDYALIQHENTDYHHTHGESHYLLQGVISSTNEVIKMVEKDYLSCFGV